MSRSRRKNPCRGNGGDSEKGDKRIFNRKMRTRNRRKLRQGEEEVFDKTREVCDVWDFRKDGKCWYPCPTESDRHVRWLARWYGISIEEALEMARKDWRKAMKK
jgi:hypothetical protein